MDQPKNKTTKQIDNRAANKKKTSEFYAHCALVNKI